MDAEGGSKLPHSQSTPAGVDGGGGSRTPPATPKKGGKMLAVRVQMLDDSVTMFQVQAKALGRVLFDQVCKQLHLLEADYFGLEYQDASGTKYWLDLEKPLARQVELSLVDTLLRFCVKFYTPDPAQLEEEFTRYLFCLQIKRDLAQGLLQCNDNTAALMASYIVQAECGDYVVEDYPDHTYLSSYKFVPNQDHELERRIMENHKKHAGQPPAEADLNLLETARRCELYGMKMHPAKDHEGVPLNLAVAHMGIVVFQNFTKINTFSWAKIRKISFKRKRFLIKLHPEGYGYYKDTVEFFFEGRNECKNFWKKCVENHGFFRCSAVKHVPRQKTRVLSRGSSFRYSGRTQKQIVEFVRENYVKRQTFQRSQSFRHSSSVHSSVANVGTSVSAHPLLPLGENAVAGTPASLSCGSMNLGSLNRDHHHRHSNRHPQSPSMTATSSPTHTADIHDFDTKDYVVVPTLTPSPPLTTSLSPGTSVTSSPQHFYPRSAITGSAHAITDDEEQEYHTNNSLQSPYHHRNTGQRTCKRLITTSPTQTITTTHPVTTTPPLCNINEHTNSVSNTLKYPKPNHGRLDWQRSASCKNLRSEKRFEYSGETNGVDVSTPYNDSMRGYYESIYKQERTLDAPVTRYDDSRRVCYSATGSKTNSVDRGSDAPPDTRIYSSSYPGTTSSLSTESGGGEEPGMMEAGSDFILLGVTGDTGSQEDILYSHEDLSHDSYELLEREQDEDADGDDEQEMDGDVVRGRVKVYAGTRSCSLDSGGENLPMDGTEESRLQDDRSPETDGVFVMDSDEMQLKKPASSSETYIKVIDSKRLINIEVADKGIGSIDYREEGKGVDNRRFANIEMADKGIGSIDYREDYMIREELTASYANENNLNVKYSLKHADNTDSCIVKSDSGLFDVNGQLSSEDRKLEEMIDELERAQAHFSEYNVKCEPGTVIGFSVDDDISRRSSGDLSAHFPVERARSDPHARRESGESKRRTLTHQKSIDLTPADGGEGGAGEKSESVLDLTTVGMGHGDFKIPYVLHKRHAMNGTAAGASQFPSTDSGQVGSNYPIEVQNLDQDKDYLFSPNSFHSKGANTQSDVSFEIVKLVSDSLETEVGKKQIQCLASQVDALAVKTDKYDKVAGTAEVSVEQQKLEQTEISVKDVAVEGGLSIEKKTVTQEELLTEGTTSNEERHVDRQFQLDINLDNKIIVSDEDAKTAAIINSNEARRISSQISDNDMSDDASVGTQEKTKAVIDNDGVKKEVLVSNRDDRNMEVGKKSIWKADLPTPALISLKHDRSPILFARARLGLSEGSAFAPVHASPTTSRRAKSLDAPVVSVHHLPPATAFSSKDDTVDNNGDGATPGVARHAQLTRQIAGSFSSMKVGDADTAEKASRRCLPSTIIDEDLITSKQLLVTSQTQGELEIICDGTLNVSEHKSTESTTSPKILTPTKETGIISPSTDVSTDTEMQLHSDSVSLIMKQSLTIRSPLKEAPRLLSPKIEVRHISSPVSPSRSPIQGLEEKVSSLHNYFEHKVKKFIEEASSTESSTNIDDGQEPQPVAETSTKKDLAPNDSFEYTTERSAFLLRDTGSSGDYQTFDDIDLPAELKDEPQKTTATMAKLEVPEDLSGNDSASNKSIEELDETADKNENVTPIQEVDAMLEQRLSPEGNRDTSDKLDLTDDAINMDASTERKIPDVLSDYDNLSPPPTLQDDEFADETPVVSSKEFFEIDLKNEDRSSVVEEREKDFENESSGNGHQVVDIIRRQQEVPVLTQDVDGNWVLEQSVKPPEESRLDTESEKKGESSPETPRDDKSSVERTKSEEEASTSSSLNLPHKVELSSTWRPFLLESSGSSSLEEGFFPPDDSAHMADEEETSSTSNNRDDTFQDDVIDFPTGFGYPCIGSSIGMSGADMIVGGYGGTFALSRTLSRISERSTTSEQERSDLDDDSTKPSSHSPSVDDESILSSDRQPSLSSDPPSGSGQQKEAKQDSPPLQHTGNEGELLSTARPISLLVPGVSTMPHASDDDWPSPPTSSSVFETPVVSHVETFYMEIHPEEACKVLVLDSTDPTGGDGSSTDENQTLHDEDEEDEDGEFMSGFGDDCLSSSAGTLDGTVKVAVRTKRPSHYCTGSSLSEDTSMGLSMSEWSSSTGTVRQQCPVHYSSAKSDDTSLDDLGASVSDLSTSRASSSKSAVRSRSPSYYSGAKSDTCLDETSPTRLGKPFIQKSQAFTVASKSLTNVGTALEDIPVPIMSSERPVKVVRQRVTPYYSTAGGSREFSKSGLIDTESSERSSSTEQNSSVHLCSEDYSYSSQSHSSERTTSVRIPARTKGYLYYSSAKSPPSDGGSSSSLDGSSALERAPRVPKRKKSQSKRRHKVTVELEVRDGHIVEVPAAPTQSVVGDLRGVSPGSDALLPSAPLAPETDLHMPKQSSV